MHYYLKSIFIIKSSSGPCHKDPGDSVSFTRFSVVDHPIPTNPHKKKRLKSDSEISYFFFDLFFFLKAKPIINRIIPKRNNLFPNRIYGMLCGDWLGMGSKWWRFHLCLLDLMDLIGKAQNSILLSFVLKIILLDFNNWIRIVFTIQIRQIL